MDNKKKANGVVPPRQKRKKDFLDAPVSPEMATLAERLTSSVTPRDSTRGVLYSLFSWTFNYVLYGN